MLRSIVLELEGERDYVRKNFLGYQVYSFFINQLKKIDEEKATHYHQKNKQKPFTITSPFLKEERIFIRFSFLNDEVFSIFLSSLFNQKKINIEKEFSIKKVYLTPEKNLPKTIQKMIKYYPNDEKLRFDRLKIITLSPIVFKSGENFEIIPTVSLIKNSFLQKQQEIYGKEIFKLPEFVISKINLKSKKVDVNPFGKFIGAVGDFEIKLKEKNPDIFALEFFGLGMKTTMGLGQIMIKEMI